MDRYDEAIELLMRSPVKEMYNAWNKPQEHPAGALFEYLVDDLYTKYKGRSYASDNQPCGCLTLVKYNQEHSNRGGLRYSPLEMAKNLSKCFNVDMHDLSYMNWKQFSAKYNLPSKRRRWLEQFAKYQRIADAEIQGRTT